MNQAQDAKSYLCFDFGLKRFGVAVGNDFLQTANQLQPLQAKDGIPNWDVIEQLVNEWKPSGFVVGLPLNMDGSESQLSVRATKFGKRLKGRYNKPVAMMDERLSSFEAKSRVKAHTNRYVDFGDYSVDGEAACLILESWFASQHSSQAQHKDD